MKEFPGSNGQDLVFTPQAESALRHTHFKVATFSPTSLQEVMASGRSMPFKFRDYFRPEDISEILNQCVSARQVAVDLRGVIHEKGSLDEEDIRLKERIQLQALVPCSEYRRGTIADYAALLTSIPDLIWAIKDKTIRTGSSVGSTQIGILVEIPEGKSTLEAECQIVPVAKISGGNTFLLPLVLPKPWENPNDNRGGTRIPANPPFPEGGRQLALEVPRAKKSLVSTKFPSSLGIRD